jgi:transposase-like protein
MANQRKRHSGDFKSKVALEALRGLRTVNEIAGEHGIHPAQVSQWKKQLQEGVSEIFSTKREKVGKHEAEQLQDPLYQEIGRLKMELAWLKKKAAALP